MTPRFRKIKTAKLNLAVFCIKRYEPYEKYQYVLKKTHISIITFLHAISINILALISDYRNVTILIAV